MIRHLRRFKSENCRKASMRSQNQSVNRPLSPKTPSLGGRTKRRTCLSRNQEVNRITVRLLLTQLVNRREQIAAKLVRTNHLSTTKTFPISRTFQTTAGPNSTNISTPRATARANRTNRARGVRITVPAPTKCQTASSSTSQT